MIESLKLFGKSIFKLDNTQYECFIIIDIENNDIKIYGDFEDIFENRSNIFDYIRSKNTSLEIIELYNNFGKISGRFDSFFISGVTERGYGLYTGSVISKILHYNHKYNYNGFKITPTCSRLTFTIDTKNVDVSEIWFYVPSKPNLNHSQIQIYDKQLYFRSDDQYVIISCNEGEITENEISKLRAAISFIMGTEVFYLYGFKNSIIEINLMEKHINKGTSPITYKYYEKALMCFLNYCNQLSKSEFEKFENSIYIYLSGKTGSIYMNSRLSLFFICIESLLDDKDSIPLEQKILLLFNLDNPNYPNHGKNTISYSINNEIATSCARIRNLIIHQGFMAEYLYDHCKNNGILKSQIILNKCKNNCIDLWLYLTTLLNIYFLNKIEFKGEYYDASNNFKVMQTL